MIAFDVSDGQLFRGADATLLVALFRRFARVQGKRRKVQPPADFAAAIDEVLTPGHKATVSMDVEAIEDEHIGEEFSTKPWLY